MTQTRIQIDDVTYNAATQCFEASVTIQDAKYTRKFPCAIEAPITMDFVRASEGLKKQALRQNEGGAGLYSQMHRRVTEQRAGRQRFDARSWLSQFGFGANDKAA
jgi:hypothetical protein